MKSQIATFKKGDPQWLELRKKFITGTEMAGLFGFNKYLSPAKILREKECSTFKDNVFTRMGKILEPAVLNFASEQLKADLHLAGSGSDNVMIYNEEMRISATPDAYHKKLEAGVGVYLLELKTTSLKNLVEWEVNPPVHYLLQLAVQGVLLNIKLGYLVIMHPRYPDLPGIIFKLDIDIPKIRTILTNEVVRFWASEGFKVDKQKADQLRELLMSNTKLKRSTLLESDKTPEPLTFLSWDESNGGEG